MPKNQRCWPRAVGDCGAIDACEGVLFGRVGRLEKSPDAAGEVALEAADRFAGAFAFAAASLDVVAGLGVTAGACDDHAVKRGVDLAVAALVEALALRVARAGGDRRDAGGAGELGRCREALGAGDLADELGGDQRPEAGLVE
jgi:hypothetical protein